MIRRVRAVVSLRFRGWASAAVYDRYALQAGDRISGPAIVEEREATTVIPPGDTVEIEITGIGTLRNKFVAEKR